MLNPHKTKEKLYEKILETIQSSIASTRSAIEAVKAARDNETKSSAGDKYETGRAMMQREIGRLEGQLSQHLAQQNQIKQINIHKSLKSVASGALVFSNAENYFIGIGLGKIMLDEETFFVISLASPIGKLLYNKKEGDTVNFRSKEILIEKIV